MQSQFLKDRANKKKNFDVDITPLLDILVILLIFLIKAYNPDESTLDVVENLNLPFSDSREIRQISVTVQVNKDRVIWVEGEKVGEILEKTGESIPILLSVLKREKERLNKENRVVATVEEEKVEREDKIKRVNIVLDKNLPYKILRKVMHTSTLAGFNRFKFIVIGASGEF